MSLRLKKTLCYVFIGLLLFLVAQLASGMYTYTSTLTLSNLPDYAYPEGHLKTQLLPQIYNAQDMNCVKCHYHQADRKTCAGHENLRCTDCHVELKELFEYKRHEEDLPSAIKACIQCHEDYDKTHDLIHANVEMPELSEFEELPNKSEKKPDCLDCHDPHETNNEKAFNRTINKCIECHDDIYIDYTSSKHYAEILAKNPNAPNCLKCHDHTKPLNREKTLLICAKCHLDSKKHNIDKLQKVTGYFTEFHGKHALSQLEKGGIVETLECKNCHDIHKVNTLNVLSKEKCCANQDCHEGTSESFHKAMIPHGRRNLSADTDFAPWLFNLLGKIILAGCIFLAFIDNILSVYFYKRTKKSRPN